MVSEINRSRSDLSGCWGCGASSEIPSSRRTASVSSYGLHRSYCLLCFEREVRWLVANVNGAVHASSSARLSIKRRTSRLESRIHSIRWLLLPFPKLQLRFLSNQVLSSRFFQQKRGTSITEKSATFAFFFFVLFGMVADQEQVGLDHFPHQRSATTRRCTVLYRYSTSWYVDCQTNWITGIIPTQQETVGARRTILQGSFEPRNFGTVVTLLIF